MNHPVGLLYPLLGYNAMNLSDCAMTKENTPIFSCVDDIWAKGTPAFNGTFAEGTTAFNGTSSLIQTAKCKNHMDRRKDDKSTIIWSWRCPDFWQESRNAINDYCGGQRPGMLATGLGDKFVIIKLSFFYWMLQRKEPYSSHACRKNVAHANRTRAGMKSCSGTCSRLLYACSC